MYVLYSASLCCFLYCVALSYIEVLKVATVDFLSLPKACKITKGSKISATFRVRPHEATPFSMQPFRFFCSFSEVPLPPCANNT